MTLKICEPALHALLIAAATAAGSNVFAARAPQGQVGSFIVFQRATGTRWRSINNPSGVAQALMRIDAYAPDYYAMKALAAEIEAALDGYRGLVYHGSNSPQDSVLIAGISLQTEFDLQDDTDEPFMERNSASYLVTYHQR